MSLLYRITCDGYVLMDQRMPGSTITEAEFTGEINDGMFDGSLSFAMTYENPYIDKIQLMRSTIIVTEFYSINNDPTNCKEKRIFRGRPVSIKPTFDGQVKVTCENDLKFLLDVPDIFSKQVSQSTTYKTGSEEEYRKEVLGTIPIGKPVPFSTFDKSDTRTRFGEERTYTHNGVTKNIYRSIQVAPLTYSVSYMLHSKDAGKRFTLELRLANGTLKKYELPLKTCRYRTFLYKGLGLHELYNEHPYEIESVARYFGNIDLVAPGNINSIAPTELKHMPEDTWVYDTEGYNPNEEVTVISGEPTGTTVRYQDLDFCIVHYHLSPHWLVDPYYDTVSWYTYGETVVYIASESPVEFVELKIYRAAGTTIRGMAHAIFGSNAPVEYASTLLEMTDTSKRYHYTGPYQKFVSDCCYEYDSTTERWLNIGSVSGIETVDVSTIQNMTDTSVIYRFIGPDTEEYYGDETYSYDGSRWVKESLCYNSFVAGNRKIYLGESDIDADVEYSQVDSCYSNLQKWLTETGGYAKIEERNGLYYLKLMSDSGIKSSDFRATYGENVLDASKDMSCENIVTGIFPSGIWNGSSESDDENNDAPSSNTQADENYQLRILDLNAKEVSHFQDIANIDLQYRYTGPNQSFYSASTYQHSGLYYYSNGQWLETNTSGGRETVSVETPSDFPKNPSDPERIYNYTGVQTSYKHGSVYYHTGDHWVENTELVLPVCIDGFELDIERGVLWNIAAREKYGEIVSYLEVDVANIVTEQRMQHLVDKSTEELQHKLSAFLSVELTVVDPRAIGMDGDSPVLGNYYPIDIPWLGLEDDYRRMSKIVVNMLDAKNTKITLGHKIPLLSDYVAQKGERL